MRLKNISISDRELFFKYYEDAPPSCSYLSFANLFIWKDAEDIAFFEFDGLLVVTGRSLYDGSRYFMFPIGKGLCAKVRPMLISNFGEDFHIYGMTEGDAAKMREKCGGQFVIERRRDMDNYVYLSERLISLSGKKLHAKRNHINRFREKYEYAYETLNDGNRAELDGFIEKWYAGKDGDRTLELEKSAVYNALDYHRELEMKCGMIKVGGSIAAFSVGERLNGDTALIHVEKADVSYDGAYAVINNEFVKNEWGGLKYVNREDDMGLPGLRKSKLSYYPEFMVEMYSAKVNIC